MKIHKGDDVLVLAGKFRGERAEVEEALPASQKVILDGLNIAKRHTKQAGLDHAGRHHRQVDAAARLDVALWCDEGDKGPAKAGYRSTDGTKVRVCRKCGETL